MSLNTTLDAMVLLGDSITEQSWAKEGLSSRLSEFYVRKLDIINRGYGGFNTRDLLPIAENLFRPTTSTDLPKVKQITLFLGANDAVLFGPQLVPLGEYTQNLSAILTLLPPDIPKLLITPPIPDGPAWCARKEIPGLQPNRSEENTGKYAAAVVELGKEMSRNGFEVWTIDLWEAMDQYRRQPGQSLGDLLSDGLHLSERGNKLLSDLVIETLFQKGS
ncbi:SGNH hydrolase-type esterase domain-containing protein [Mrakia frigida]|uniref:SGNH/GDSL hydrolase family protein n=1 Tax=Mrakia frigida TaxID=29902 RepID=UPI003FCC1F1F